MKIVQLIGSPHGIKGSTARLARIVSDGAESMGAAVETVVLKGKTVLPCKGCDACHKTGRCVQKDEFESIKEKILDADGVILASPNYIFSVSAQMKAFMDRCCQVIHCLSFEGKYGVSVVTSGGGDEAPIADYMNHFLMITGIRPAGAVWATMGTIEGDGFPEPIHQNAFDLGKTLVTAWQNKTVSAETEKTIQEFKERMRSLMLWRKDEWPYEYEFWKTRRGLV